MERPLAATPDPIVSEGAFSVIGARGRLLGVTGSGIVAWVFDPGRQGDMKGEGGRLSFDPDRRPTRAADAHFPFPEGVILDASGNLFIADMSRRLVCKVTPEGGFLTLAGPPELSVPGGLAVDSTGDLFIADVENPRVLRVGSDGRLRRVAGTGAAGFSGDGGPALAAQLNSPWGLAVDSQGNLYIADTRNHRIRKVAPDGTITTVAGTGTAGFSGDGGTATAAQLDRPLGMALDSRENLFIVDSLNGRIRRVDRNGGITTVFDGAPGADSGAASPSVRYYPARVAVDREGNLLIADPFHHRVLVVAGVAAPPIAGR